MITLQFAIVGLIWIIVGVFNNWILIHVIGILMVLSWLLNEVIIKIAHILASNDINRND